MVRCMVEDMLYTKNLIHKNKNSCIRHSLVSLALFVAGIVISGFNTFMYKDYFVFLVFLLFILNVVLSIKAFKRFRFYEAEDSMYELYQRCPNKVEVEWYDLRN